MVFVAPIATLVKGILKIMSNAKFQLSPGVVSRFLLACAVAMPALSCRRGGESLSSAEIYKRTQEKYAALTSYSDEGESVGTLNDTTNSYRLDIKLARPNLYRVDWVETFSGKGKTSQDRPEAVWSAGEGDFSDFAFRAKEGAHKEASQQEALCHNSGSTGGATETIPGIFFKLKPFCQLGDGWAKAKRQPDERVGDMDCYVLTGNAPDPEDGVQTLWIGKQDFLIRQHRAFVSADALKAAMDARFLKTHPGAVIPQGQYYPYTELETHTNIVVNQKLSPADFSNMLGDAGDYNRALSADEVQTLVKSNGGVKAPFSGMALIPAGPFMMGDSLDGERNAIPPVSVTVSAFYMDVNLVSFSQWESVYNWAVDHGYGFAHAGDGKEANHPVQMVDWYDCVKWCNARSQQAGLTPAYYTDAGLTRIYTNGEVAPFVNWKATGCRLPTEAEWEKAARGGLSGQRFPWGNTVAESQANYRGDIGHSYDLGPNGFNAAFSYGVQPYTSPVGYFAPNGYGLYDMTGNVLEWCWNPAGAVDSGSNDPHGQGPGIARVLRGGYWKGNALSCANRIHQVGASSVLNVRGFRCVRGI
jgi:formylglycine-generating enzyme required for sulfatase activity